MVAPLVIAAGLGAAGSALGGVMGGKGAKKAAKVAAKSQERITSMNNALIQGMYNQNAERIDPFVQGGTRAGNVLMELLLGNYGAAPGSPGTVGSGAGGYGDGGTWSGPSAQEQLDFLLHGSQDVIGPNRTADIMQMQGTPEQKLAYATSVLHDKERNYYNQYMQANPRTFTPAPAPAAPAAGGAGTPNALSAWDAFRNSTNYDWRLGQGTEAVQQGFAGQSTDSGAEKLALLEYGQNYASNELGNWMNMLAGQQSLGANAANALAGVGTNATSQLVNSNQALGDARGNQALINGAANQSMWGGIGQGIGQIAGAWGSSYGQPASAPPAGGPMSYNLPQTYNYGY